MRKIISPIILCVFMFTIFTFTLTACGDNQSGTYYPKSDEMKSKLESNGYTVNVTADLGDHSGIYLSATKGNEYINFYWLDHAEDCAYFYHILETAHGDAHSLVKIENDETFGNLVYGGTENAVTAAGIKVVKVTVKV